MPSCIVDGGVDDSVVTSDITAKSSSAAMDDYADVTRAWCRPAIADEDVLRRS